MNQRKKALIIFAITVGFLTFVTVFGIVVTDGARVTDFSKKNMAPCLSYLFGTDWLGRDMLLRTFAGLSMSIRIGLLAAGFSAIIAFVLGVSAAVFGGKADAVISFVIACIEGKPEEFFEPVLILLIVALNAVMGVLQESKAEKAMDALLSVSAMDTEQACREDRDALRHGDH